MSPFLDMLVGNWASGRLIREYTFLLDPRRCSASRPVAVSRRHLRHQWRNCAGRQTAGVTSARCRGKKAGRCDHLYGQDDAGQELPARPSPRESAWTRCWWPCSRKQDAFDGNNMNRLQRAAF